MDFESSVNEIDEVTREIKVVVPEGELVKRYEEALKDLTRDVVIKGFRQGKAPRPIVEKVYGPKVRADVAQKLINVTLSDLAKQHTLNIIGDPEIEISGGDTGQGMSYVAKVSLFPSPSIVGYDKFTVQVAKKEANDEGIEKVIDGLRSSKATMRRLEFRNTAQKGDVVDVSLSVTRPGEQRSRPEPVVVSLGDGNLPAEVEAALEGMEVGTSKEVSSAKVESVSDEGVQASGNENAIAPTTLYNVTLNALYEKILPEFTDEFVKGLSLGVETVLELRMKVREELAAELEKQSKTEIHAEIIDQLVKANEFRVPQVLIDEELRALLRRSGIMPAEKVDTIDLEPFRGELAEVALKRVRGAIALDRISEIEGIKVEKDEVEKEMQALAEKSGADVDQVREVLSQQGRFVAYVMELTRNKVLDFLVSRTEINHI